jgi:hypothetical protein
MPPWVFPFRHPFPSLQRLASAEDVSGVTPISQTRKKCFGFTLTGSAAPHPHPLAPSAGHSLASSSFARFNATPSEAIIASSIGPALATGSYLPFSSVPFLS